VTFKAMKNTVGCLISLSALMLASSCIGPGIAAKADVVRIDLVKAKKSGAYKCAPIELAMAEAHTDFAEAELAEGDFIRAQEHIDIAVENKTQALENSKGCAPKKILIKKNIDSDQDGIPDKRDSCPENPEDIDQFEDEDGCPDPDNDQDTVLDPMDECPNQAGPADNLGCPYGDRDGDGIDDQNDKCPDKPEDFDEDRDEDGCPDVDTDKDGLEDDVDQCPTQPEDIDGFVDDDGCPDIDNDQDGIIDTVDQCPVEAGLPQATGCPDMDGDFVADKDDKCPEEYGVRQPDNPEKNGCPKEYKLIVIKKDRIEIKQQVHFETAKATIKRSSYPLLAEVADAIKSAELKAVRIEGHTDSDGSELYNLKLSQARADSVRTHLVEIEGIDSSLLEAIGFGESRPLASNDTPGGKAKNRRVEFHISR